MTDAQDVATLVEDILGTLFGDANLDGTVDGQDFIAWNNSKFTSLSSWAGGDFDGNGTVDGQDFIIWNNYKFMTAGRGRPATVPEPNSGVLLVIFLIGAGQFLHRQLDYPD